MTPIAPLHKFARTVTLGLQPRMTLATQIMPWMTRITLGNALDAVPGTGFTELPIFSSPKLARTVTLDLQLRTTLTTQGMPWMTRTTLGNALDAVPSMGSTDRPTSLWAGDDESADVIVKSDITSSLASGVESCLLSLSCWVDLHGIALACFARLTPQSPCLSVTK